MVLSSGTLDLLSFYSFTFLLLNIAVQQKIEKVVRFFYQAICMEFKVRRLARKTHYLFNAHGVCRRYTSMRNPLQAAKRRSCGYNCMRGECSAKRDLHILLTANGISPPSGNRPCVLTTHSCAASLLAVGFA